MELNISMINSCNCNVIERLNNGNCIIMLK